MYHDTPEVFLKSFVDLFRVHPDKNVFEHAPLEIVVSTFLAGSWYPE
jgi:hypothetical protein